MLSDDVDSKVCFSHSERVIQSTKMKLYLPFPPPECYIFSQWEIGRCGVEWGRRDVKNGGKIKHIIHVYVFAQTVLVLDL